MRDVIGFRIAIFSTKERIINKLASLGIDNIKIYAELPAANYYVVEFKSKQDYNLVKLSGIITFRRGYITIYDLVE